VVEDNRLPGRPTWQDWSPDLGQHAGGQVLVRFAVWAPNFGVFADARLIADLAARTEAAGWDGWFLWDHVVHISGKEPVVDPWMALALAATSTSRIRLGPLVTPVPRRRPWNLARQAATLDRISGGRAVLGVGSGSERTPEFRGYGEETDLARRASMLDEGLELISELWTGATVHHAGQHYQVDGVAFQPVPVQDPLPIWVGAVWPHPRPLRRAARWQGVATSRLPGPEVIADIRRVVGPDKDIAVPADERPARDWAAAGATWWVRTLRADDAIGDVEAMIDAGPPRD
jgi:alkanesulfonate monooxygenase SsuD/methylene tetrahydromethanopterin reductase-like flavin-dependent oxidoreductase (luciferase family)